MKVRRWPLVLCLLLGGCAGLGAKMARSLSDDPREGRPTVTLPEVRDSAEPTHYAVVAYDVCGEAAQAAEELRKKRQLEAAGARLQQVQRLAGEALERVERDKLSGAWLPALRYPTRDGALGGDELLARIARLRDEARAAWTGSLWPAILSELRRRYHARSAAQIEVLEQLGRPEAQSTTPRGERCWTFSPAEQRVTYCWDGRGQMTRRTLGERPEGAPRRPALPMTLAEAAAQRPRPAAPPAPPAPLAPAASAAPSASASPAAPPASAAPPTPASPAAPSAFAAPAAPSASAAPAASPAPASAAPAGPGPAAGARTAAPGAPASARTTAQQLALLRHGAETLAAGACRDRSCLRRGWTLRASAAEVQVQCAPDGCGVEGWTATTSAGARSRSTCLQGDCLKEGWETTHADGSRSQSICSFNDCWKSGWVTSAPGRPPSPSSCDRGDCGRRGWTTLLPGGRSLRCRCVAQSCADNGAECD